MSMENNIEKYEKKHLILCTVKNVGPHIVKWVKLYILIKEKFIF